MLRAYGDFKIKKIKPSFTLDILLENTYPFSIQCILKNLFIMAKINSIRTL
jgi:hypothetical protein